MKRVPQLNRVKTIESDQDLLNTEAFKPRIKHQVYIYGNRLDIWNSAILS